MSYIKKNQPIWVVLSQFEDEKYDYTRVICSFLDVEDAIACINNDISNNYSGWTMYEYQWESKTEFVCRIAQGHEFDPDTGDLDINMADSHVTYMCVKCGLV